MTSVPRIKVSELLVGIQKNGRQSLTISMLPPGTILKPRKRLDLFTPTEKEDSYRIYPVEIVGLSGNDVVIEIHYGFNLESALRIIKNDGIVRRKVWDHMFMQVRWDTENGMPVYNTRDQGWVRWNIVSQDWDAKDFGVCLGPLKKVHI